MLQHTGRFWSRNMWQQLSNFYTFLTWLQLIITCDSGNILKLQRISSFVFRLFTSLMKMIYRSFYEWMVCRRSSRELLQTYTDFNQRCSGIQLNVFFNKFISLTRKLRTQFRASELDMKPRVFRPAFTVSLRLMVLNHITGNHFYEALQCWIRWVGNFLQLLLLQDLPLKMNIYTGDRKFLAPQCLLLCSHESQWSWLCLCKPWTFYGGWLLHMIQHNDTHTHARARAVGTVPSDKRSALRRGLLPA
jgi:hypothetical protein